MPNGRSRIPFAHILRFAYFTASALSLVWMLAQYGQVNFISAIILLPAFGYIALHLISLINVVQKDRFLVGSSVDVLSLNAQKWIHRSGLLLALPVLIYTAVFGMFVFSYNPKDMGSYNRMMKFSTTEYQVFGKSVLWNYVRTPDSVAVSSLELPAESYDETSASAHSEPASNEVDFGPYMANMQRRIKRNWFPPKVNGDSEARVVFSVSRDGVISSVHFVKHASSTLADDAVLQALRCASPLRPLPEGSPETIDVLFTFDYNLGESTAPVQSF